MKYLWHSAFTKARGASHILVKFGDLNDKIYIYGTTKKTQQKEQQSEMEGEIAQINRFVIMPDSHLNSYWNLIMTILLLYTASYMPFRISFVDTVSIQNILFDSIIDLLFIIDIIIHFFSPYEDPKLGMVYSLKKISLNYIFSWFCFDIFSCLPMQLLELDNLNPDANDDANGSSSSN